MRSNTHPPTPNFTLPPAYSNWLSATKQRNTFLRDADCAASPFKKLQETRQLFDLDSSLALAPPQKKNNNTTGQADSYLLEESRDGVAGTEARHGAEAPRRPLGGGHDGGAEPSDPERTRRRRSCRSAAPAVYVGLCACARLCPRAGQAFADISLASFFLLHICPPSLPSSHCRGAGFGDCASGIPP